MRNKGKTRAGEVLARALARSIADSTARQHLKGKTNPIEAGADVHECASMCTDVRECASPEARAGDETKPMPLELTDRQVAAARLLALGRTGRDTAAEIGVNPHTIVRWRRLSGFQAEVRRQHALILAQQIRPTIRPTADAEPGFARGILRKYGLTR